MFHTANAVPVIRLSVVDTLSRASDVYNKVCETLWKKGEGEVCIYVTASSGTGPRVRKEVESYVDLAHGAHGARFASFEAQNCGSVRPIRLTDFVSCCGKDICRTRAQLLDVA